MATSDSALQVWVSSTETILATSGPNIAQSRLNPIGASRLTIKVCVPSDKTIDPVLFFLKLWKPCLERDRQTRSILHPYSPLLVDWRYNELNSLAHCGLVTPYGDINPDQHWPRQWLAAWCTKPLPELISTYHQSCSVEITWEQFHKECPRKSSVTCVLSLHLLYQNGYNLAL